MADDREEQNNGQDSESEDGKKLLEQAAKDAKSLSLHDALKLEEKVEQAHEDCPKCSEDFEDVGIFNSGTLMFIHDDNGVSVDGCKFEDPTEVSL